MHRFTIDYTDGLLINNVFVDSNLLTPSSPRNYTAKIYFNHRKIKKYLHTFPDHLGVSATTEEIVTADDKTLITVSDCQLGCWTVPFFNKHFIPYTIEIGYGSDIIHVDKLDCKFKLINFNLEPKNDRELYVWMNVNENFKKEMQCNISIKNDTVFSTNEFDNIVDVKYPLNDPNKQYYLGLKIGRFYQPNSNNPDFLYHPDGLHNKNSLDIINDILYYHSYIV